MNTFADGVSICGSCHEENQDAFLCQKLKNNDWILVVSDGVGSRQDSARGAQALCKSVIETAQLMLNAYEQPETFVRAIHHTWTKNLEGFDITNCYATLLVLYVQGSRALAIRLGDGFIALRCDGQVRVLYDDKQDHFTNETDCMTEAPVWQRIAYLQQPYMMLQGAILCSDGIGIKVMDEKLLMDFTADFTGEFSGISPDIVKAYVKKLLEGWPGQDDKTMAYLLLSEKEPVE